MNISTNLWADHDLTAQLSEMPYQRDVSAEAILFVWISPLENFVCNYFSGFSCGVDSIGGASPGFDLCRN
ncbi:unnamed protein product [Protopolystoma xenopodis]|uniref:Uncharacterized protein n=1 Tax=Protopolystoma xenopodis TaxID=117903 RepID=A0A448XJ78_9PLAT|nr:unnamed protein product [Protopolystoma xenopodis]